MDKALPYNFKNNVFLPNIQLEFINKVHHSFAKQAASTLSTLLRDNVNVDLLETDQIPLSLFLRSHSMQCSYAYLASSLSKSSILTISPELAYAAVSRLLGGGFKDISVIRTFTSLEIAILRQFINSFIKPLKETWEPYLDFSPNIHEMGTDLSKMERLQKTSKYVVVTFKITFSTDSGFIALLFPCDCLYPLHSVMVSNDRKASERLDSDLQNLEISLKVTLGSLNLSPHELLNLKKGDVLKLDQLLNQPVPVLVENTPALNAYPGLTYKNKGVTLYARS